jgi:hypothetical protein
MNLMKENKVPLKEQNKALCDSCGFYFNHHSLIKNKNGRIYCVGCNSMGIKAKNIKTRITLADLDKMEKKLKTLLNTPPPKKNKGKVKKRPSSNA